MARITTYTEVGSSQGTPGLQDADVFILDGQAGSRKITAKEFANAMADKLLKNGAAAPYGKSGMYRGANLGSGATFAAASTAAQRNAIDDGTFTGLFIGDYWTIGNVVYRIADFNYWKRSGDTDFNTNHIVLVPDNHFGNGKMNANNDTTGAYIGSEMYSNSSSVLGQVRTIISNDFGGYLASHKEYFANSITDGAESGGAWVTSTVDLMNEPMVYGSYIKTKAMAGLNYYYTIDKAQLALFRLNPAMVNTRYTYWLRNVASISSFANVDAVGGAGYAAASGSYGVRPAFAVKGTA